MGKKLAPLRKYAANSLTGRSLIGASVASSSSSSSSSATTTSHGINNLSGKKRSKEAKSGAVHSSSEAVRLDKGDEVDVDDDAYWERIETEHSRKKSKKKSKEQKLVAPGTHSTGKTTVDAQSKHRSADQGKRGRLDESESNELDEDQSSSSSSSPSSSSSDDDDDDDDDDEGIPLAAKNITHISEQFTFEFNDMREAFVEGVTTLLRTKFILNPTIAYHVACDVTAQTAVGTAIVCEGGDDVFAFATVLPMVRLRAGLPYHNILASLAHELSSNAAFRHSENASLMSSCITGQQVKAAGLLIHRRFFNLPIELIGHLHSNLKDDLCWAQGMSENDDGSGDSRSAEEHSLFRSITHILLISPCTLSSHVQGQGQGQGQGRSGSKKQKKTASASASASVSAEGNDNKESGAVSNGSSTSSSSSSAGGGSSSSKSVSGVMDVTGGGGASIIFENFEDEMYFQESTCSFFLRPDSSVIYPSTSLVVSLMPTSSFQKCVQGICQLMPASTPAA